MAGGPPASSGTPAAAPAEAPAGRPTPARDVKGTTPHGRLAALVPQLTRGEGTALTATEASSLRAPLVEALQRYTEYADEAIWLTGRKSRQLAKPADFAIWSDMDPEEIGVVVSVWLRAGQRSAVVAASVRSAVDLYRRLQVAIIIAPRFRKTFAFYMEQGGVQLW